MMESVMGGGLKWLGRVASSDLVDKLGLRERTERWVYTGTKTGFSTAAQVAEKLGPALKVSKPGRLPGKTRPKIFDLSLSDEQQMIRDTVRRFAEAQVRPAARAADDACEPPADLLEASLELGLGWMAIPESLGGAGTERDPLTSALVLEELSRGDMALALALGAPLGTIGALVDWGTAAQQARYLAPFLGESFVGAAMALVEPRPLFDPYQLKTRATASDGGYTLYGKKALVPLGRSAAFFLVAADVLGAGPSIFIVDADAEGLTIESEPAMGLRGADLCRLKLDGVRVERGALLGEKETDFDYGALVDRARIAWGALAVGTAQAVLEYVKEYCNDRVAFGEPITNRQSVAFMIADIAIETEGVRLMVYRAASRAGYGMDHRREAYLARLQAAEKGMKIGTDGVQLLGGHGFVKDHPVELWYRHLRGVGLMEGAVGV